MLLQFSPALAAVCITAAGTPAVAARATVSLPGAGAGLAAQQAQQDLAPDLRFARFNELKGSPVTNPNGEELGAIDDLVVDRGTGAVRYLVLERGGVLGIGAKAVALPWSQVAPASAADRPADPDAPLTAPPTSPSARTSLVAQVTPEQLEGMPEFDPEDRAAIQSQSWIEAMRSAFADWTDWSEDDHADPFAGAIDPEATSTIEGEIERIRRERDFEAAEHIVAEIRSDDGRITCALGPAWFVMGSANPPMREAKITIEAFELERNPDIDAVARSFTIDDSQMQLRSEDGTARWASADPAAQSPARSDSAGRLALASDIVGASATAHGKDAGEIKRLVIELTTGAVVFVEIDPDANFLGLAESTRLVPWEALTSVGAGRVRLDASPQTLTTAPQSPERGEAPRWFADQANRDRVYKLFDFEPRRFGNRGGDPR